MFKSMLPYFVLAIMVIIAYKAIDEFKYVSVYLGYVWAVINPFFYGFILAYILNIPCGGISRLLGKIKWKFIQKRKTGISVLLVYLLMILLIFFLVTLLIPTIRSSIEFFQSNYSTYSRDFLNLIDIVNGWGLFSVSIDEAFIGEAIQDIFGGITIENITNSLNFLMNLSSAIFSAVIAFISSIFILLEKENFKKFLSRLLKAFTSSSVYGTIIKYSTRLNYNFKQYIFTQTIDGIILGTVVGIILFLLGSPYFLVLALILGFVNYIPYFGSIFGSLFAVVVVAFTQDLTTAALAAVFLLITQQLDGNVLQPKLMGSSFKISALLVIISVTVGGAIAGILGMLAAIPIVVVLKDILENVISHYENRKALTEKEDEMSD
jgi:predicted PurR-regulated permease PerM